VSLNVLEELDVAQDLVTMILTGNASQPSDYPVHQLLGTLNLHQLYLLAVSFLITEAGRLHIKTGP